MKIKIKKATLFISLLSGVLIVAGWYLMPRMILQPQRIDIKKHPELFHYKTRPQDFGLIGEDISFITKDSIELSTLMIKSPLQPAKATIIMLHGIGACKESFLPVAAEYCKDSINVVLMDNRAHGQSSGEYCTYGFHEKNDVSELVTQLLNRDSKTPIGLYGVSLGGAIAWQTLGNDHRIAFAIIESTFDDLRNVVREYLARFIGFRFDVLADFALWRAASVAKINSAEVVPREAATQVTCPVFCAHGSRDIHIPLNYGFANFKKLGGSHHEFHIIHGADHNNVTNLGGGIYKKMKQAFITRNSFKKE